MIFAICLKQTELSKLLLLQADRKNHILTFFIHELMQIASVNIYLLLLISFNFN
jgi:hypothetical protein